MIVSCLRCLNKHTTSLCPLIASFSSWVFRFQRRIVGSLRSIEADRSTSLARGWKRTNEILSMDGAESTQSGLVASFSLSIPSSGMIQPLIFVSSDAVTRRLWLKGSNLNPVRSDEQTSDGILFPTRPGSLVFKIPIRPPLPCNGSAIYLGLTYSAEIEKKRN